MSASLHNCIVFSMVFDSDCAREVSCATQLNPAQKFLSIWVDGKRRMTHDPTRKSVFNPRPYINKYPAYSSRDKPFRINIKDLQM